MDAREIMSGLTMSIDFGAARIHKEEGFIMATGSLSGNLFHVNCYRIKYVEGAQIADCVQHRQWEFDDLDLAAVGGDAPFNTVKIPDQEGDWVVIIWPFRD